MATVDERSPESAGATKLPKQTISRQETGIGLLCSLQSVKYLYLTLGNHLDPSVRSQIAAPVVIGALLGLCEFLLDVAMDVRGPNERSPVVLRRRASECILEPVLS